MRIRSPSAVFHRATDRVVFGNLSFNLSLSLCFSFIICETKTLLFSAFISLLELHYIPEVLRRLSTGLEKKPNNLKQPKPQTKHINKTPLSSHTKTPWFALYLQSGWGNWNLLLSFLHQHKQFTKLTHHLPSNPNQWELRQNQWCFPEFSRSSSYFQHSVSSTNLSTVLCKSLLWARTPVDQDYDHSPQQLKVSSW